MSCGIYQILNSKTGKCYVGSAVDIEDRWIHHRKKLSGGSGHHSIKLQRSWNKYGPDVWEWKILQECEEDKLLWLEAFWICKLDSFDNGYNSISITLDGERLVRRHSEETREKLRNRFITDETKKKISDSNRGKKLSEEHKQKLRMIFTGRLVSEETREKLRHRAVSEETREKLRNNMLGKNRGSELGAKLSKALKGRKLTDEQKKKWSEVKLGSKHSEETKIKMRESAKLGWEKRKARQI